MKNKQGNSKITYFDLQFIISGISIMLVLVLLGTIVFCGLAANNLTVYVRENVNFSVIIGDDMKEADILKFQKELNKKPFVKSSVYISKEQALKEQTEAMGTNPKDFLGYNPFKASIELKLHSAYANTDSIAKIEKRIKGTANIQDVLYQQELIEAVNKNIRNISLTLLIPAAMLTLISFALINNTVRLAVHAQRFLIHTMTLVGAGRWFIRKPFMKKNIWCGVCAAAMAGALLMGGAYALVYYDPELIRVISPDVMLIVVAAVAVLGVIIPSACSYFSVNKYLRMKSADLYYI